MPYAATAKFPKISIALTKKFKAIFHAFDKSKFRSKAQKNNGKSENGRYVIEAFEVSTAIQQAPWQSLQTVAADSKRPSLRLMPQRHSLDARACRMAVASDL